MTEQPKPPPKIEDTKTGVVLVDGVRVWGSVGRELTECGHPRIYAERWDAYFCPVDDKWLEGTCGDPLCGYCPNRPDHPMEGPLDEP